MTRKATLAVVVVVVLGLLLLVSRSRGHDAPCGPGFTRAGARCCAYVVDARCDAHPRPCPLPLVATEHGCDVPRDLVEVPAVTFTMGPSDWEAEGRVRPRTVSVDLFAIDRFEVTVGRACESAIFAGGPRCADEPARAASGVAIGEARAYCASRGGRLPTDDEWSAAAAGDRPRRYPWGDTGAVCRRAAWGLASGPCAEGGSGPDTAGAHAEGATPLGIHDLAGNVSEWVERGDCPDAGPCPPIARGGSWKTSLATNLRTWLRHEASPGGDVTIGFRCAYGGVGSVHP